MVWVCVTGRNGFGKETAYGVQVLRLSSHLIIIADKAASVGFRVGRVCVALGAGVGRVGVSVGARVAVRVALVAVGGSNVTVGDGNCAHVGIGALCGGWGDGNTTRVGMDCAVPHPDRISAVIKTQMAARNCLLFIALCTSFPVDNCTVCLQ